VDEKCKGRVLFENLNLDNPNNTAVEIARGKLSSICRATGVMKVADSSLLHNIPFILKVAIEARKDTGELQNVIKGYKAIGATKAPQTQAPSDDPAPWLNK